MSEQARQPDTAQPKGEFRPPLKEAPAGASAVYLFLAETFRILDNALWLTSDPQYKHGEPIPKCSPPIHFAVESFVTVPVPEFGEEAFLANEQAILSKAGRAALVIERIVRDEFSPIGKPNRIHAAIGLICLRYEGWQLFSQWSPVTCNTIVTFPFVVERNAKPGVF